MVATRPVVIPAKAGSSIPETVVIETRVRGVLDRPFSRATTTLFDATVLLSPVRLTPNVYTGEVGTGRRIQKFKLTSDALR